MTQACADGSTPIPELMMLPYAGAGSAYSFANQASGNGPYLTIAYQPPASPTTTAPTPPVVTTPVSTPVPTPAARRSLKIKLVLSWTWNRAMC